jgi:citrate synthase
MNMTALAALKWIGGILMNKQDNGKKSGLNDLKLKGRLDELIPKWRDELRTLVKNQGDTKLDEISIGQVFGGMRGLKCIPCETSQLDPLEGIRFKGYSIPEVREKLPKPSEGDVAYPTGLWYLLLTGEVPDKSAVLDTEEAIRKRAELPQHVFDAINALPKTTHPMTQLSIGILAMRTDSVFAERYDGGLSKTEFWVANLEDSLNLIARMPVLAAYIYRRSYKDGSQIPPDDSLDWGANFAHMMGIDNQDYYNLMRLYLILHSDHESGNVSAHTGFLVSSALSDMYYSVSAAIDGLAGPLHGLANQQCLKWILELMDAFGGTPTKEQVEKYAWDTLNAGAVIPGFGHAVLRNVDPRYTSQREFAMKHMPEDPIFRTVSVVFEVVPEVLKKHGKVKNPWPNVDAHSGCLQYHYGVKEFDFYTVLFGVSRALGITAQIIWARAMGLPIERPKSATLKMIMEATK